jgi:Protein of unknown function (DUF1580)
MVTNEKLYSLPEAFEQVTGERPSPATCFRWVMHGVKGVQLESCVTSRGRRTSVEAAQRFLEARTKASTPSHGNVPLRTSKQRQSDVERAEQALKKEGV